ncbi:hypothetical protein [Streptomyces caatingaensis]|uniref:hypothetical protein n=1 Tax=Streptomyces caatingaensis TaxID=1678637 RepID=UPI000A540AD2|nr:hypothetical protein [Streptomyces caatingaensis]
MLPVPAGPGHWPALQELLDPASGTSVARYLGPLLQGDPAERDKFLRDLVEEYDGVHDAMKRVMDDKRRRDREGQTGCSGGQRDKAHDLARDLIRLNDQAVALMNRYPRKPSFTDDQRSACEEALGTLEVLAAWIRVRLEAPKAAAGADRTAERDLVNA